MSIKIGVTSQNFRTITGHAGKGRRFRVFEVQDNGVIQEQERLDLPLDMSIHAWNGQGEHPIFAFDYLITAGAGEGFQRRLAQQNVKVLLTSETTPLTAVQLFVKGELPVTLATAHHLHENDHQHADTACGCGGH